VDFKNAVQATLALKQAYRPGLKALRANDRNQISVRRTRNIQGSIDLDSALAAAFPRDARWDYGVGYKLIAGSDLVYWIEIHPASTKEVDAVLRKLAWLQQWLSDGGRPLRALPCRYIWISSGTTNLSPSAPQLKSMAQKGLTNVGRHFVIK
jgi:hypothetical protein